MTNVVFLDFDGVLHARDAHWAVADVAAVPAEDLLRAGLFGGALTLPAFLQFIKMCGLSSTVLGA